MGLLSLFGKSPLTEKKIAKVAKLAANPFAQPDVRMREMQRLVDDGSDPSIRGVLRRFATNAQGHIADEDEKKWLEDALVQQAEKALPALREYILREEKLTYALRAYRRIVGDTQAVDFFIEVLNHHGPDDHRSSESKVQLIGQLGEHLQEPRVLLQLAPFLQDHSDDVRWAVLDLFERGAHAGQVSAVAQQAALQAILPLITGDDTSPRIARRAAEVLAAQQWALPAGPDSLTPLLEDAYFLDKKRFVRRRGSQSAAQ